VETLKRFCKDASQAFFNEFGLISHQINSFNQLVENKLQELFDSFGQNSCEAKLRSVEWKNSWLGDIPLLHIEKSGQQSHPFGLRGMIKKKSV